MLPNIPQNPYQGAVWQGGPFATSPAAAHGLLHRGSNARYPALDALSTLHKSPLALMSEYQAASSAAQSRAMMGLGAAPGELDTETKALVVFGWAMLALLVVSVGVRGAAGYQAGKAVSHASDNAGSYAAAGALAGVIGGVPGMAAVAAVALAMRDR